MILKYFSLLEPSVTHIYPVWKHCSPLWTAELGANAFDAG